MNKKKVTTIKPFNLVDTEMVKISKYHGEDYFFEIGKNITNDITEAVALMLRIGVDENNPIWNTEINDVNTYEINPSKSLYWLSGGDDEWLSGMNYKYHWHECVNEFSEEFGSKIIDIINESKNLRDVRNKIIRRFNLPTLFEFALERGFV